MKRAVSAVALGMTFIVVAMADSTVSRAAPRCEGEATIDKVGAVATVSCSDGPAPLRPRRVDHRYWWTRSCPDTALDAEHVVWQEGDTVSFHRDGRPSLAEVEAQRIMLTGDYHWYRVDCHLASGGVFGGHRYIWADVDPPTPEEVRDSVSALMPAIAPSVETNPTGRPQIVRIETWLWTPDPWEVKTKSKREGFAMVEVQARPHRVVWEFSDGGRVECFGPGVAWSSANDHRGTECGHTFTRAAQSVESSATIEWIYSWSMNGVPRGDFGSKTATTPFTLQVNEIQVLSR